MKPTTHHFSDWAISALWLEDNMSIVTSEGSFLSKKISDGDISLVAINKWNHIIYTRTGVIWRQGYVPEKCHSKRTQRPYLKKVYFLWVGRSTSSYIVHDHTTSVHNDLYSTYVLYTQYICTVYTVYISIHYICLLCKNVRNLHPQYWVQYIPIGLW